MLNSDLHRAVLIVVGDLYLTDSRPKPGAGLKVCRIPAVTAACDAGGASLRRSTLEVRESMASNHRGVAVYDMLLDQPIKYWISCFVWTASAEDDLAAMGVILSIIG